MGEINIFPFVFCFFFLFLFLFRSYFCLFSQISPFFFFQLPFLGTKGFLQNLDLYVCKTSSRPLPPSPLDT